MNTLNDQTLAQLFTEARTHHGFLDQDIPDDVLKHLYNLTKYGPTAFNMSPARFVFIKSKAAKEKLAQALSPGNIQQTMQAPVTVIVATDTHFYEHLPTLFPAYDAKPLYANNPTLAAEAGFRNGTLQGAYLLMAARALGLDSGAMSGFDNAKLDTLFFPEGHVRSNFLINLGYGDHSKLHPRGPRLSFDQAARIE